MPTAQSATGPTRATTLTPAQAAWQRFVEQVERGEITDPSGQYVAKETRGATDANGHRLGRPKFDAATPDFARHFNIKADGKGGVAIKAGTPVTSVTLPDNPPCDNCPIGGITPPPVYSTFTTSENRGGSGYIHDLKIATVGVVLYTNYIKLEADLNKGAGGAYINLAFTRDENSVISGREYYNGNANSSPRDIVTSFSTKIGSWYGDLPTPANYYFHLWAPTRGGQNPFLNAYTAWDYQDLNAGAGGEYIYGYQSKSDQIPSFVAQIHEIGVLSGNSATINPPAGWHKDGRDLNQGAGGEYIYFCYKY